MSADKQEFRHESLQDTQSIEALLVALSDGIKQGRILFSDDEARFEMEPQGLLQVKLTASKDDGRNRFNLRVTWQDQEEEPLKKKKLKINGKKKSSSA